jgi:hypothetical protein
MHQPGRVFEPGSLLAILRKKYWGPDGAVFAVLLAFLGG